MEGLFIRLTDAVSGPLGPAAAAAFAWGVLSIVLSPCHLASIPLIVAFLQGGAPPGRGRALLLSSLFALGILTTIALIGGLTAAAGRILGDVGAAGNVLVAVLFLAVGLAFLDVVPWNLPVPERARPRRRGAAAALLLGLVFGLALGPCTFAFMAPVLGVALRSAADHAWQGAALLTAYGLGHCLVIALAGAGSAWVQRVLDWNEDSRAAVVIRRTCGALIILAGLYLLYTAP
ncbi:MAG TPA: cytochrome c biogenesis protein CcdA [Candidatus Krumholzibacteria bacterium]|nr:cytochrome c biogenesis protein CcdA [Candidatus Krumholzibacteria bacterium]HRX52713.1 cytochrome c biogenesis protein CcdA [Candidatus Krumholzibacteria bacterium]